MDLAEASKDEVLEEFTAYSASTDHENTGLELSAHSDDGGTNAADLFDAPVQRAQRLGVEPVSRHGRPIGVIVKACVESA